VRAAARAKKITRAKPKSSKGLRWRVRGAAKGRRGRTKGEKSKGWVGEDGLGKSRDKARGGVGGANEGKQRQKSKDTLVIPWGQSGGRGGRRR